MEPSLTHTELKEPLGPTSGEQLIARSNRLGANPGNSNKAGANTSANGTETEPVTGEPVELLWVEAPNGTVTARARRRRLGRR